MALPPPVFPMIPPPVKLPEPEESRRSLRVRGFCPECGTFTWNVEWLTRHKEGGHCDFIVLRREVAAAQFVLYSRGLIPVKGATTELRASKIPTILGPSRLTRKQGVNRVVVGEWAPLWAVLAAYSFRSAKNVRKKVAALDAAWEDPALRTELVAAYRLGSYEAVRDLLLSEERRRR